MIKLRNNELKALIVAGFFILIANSSCNKSEQNFVVGKYEITSGSPRVEIPFEMYGMNIMVNAQMNDVSIKLLIDNGVMWDELWFYGSDKVDSLGFTYDQKNIQVVGAGEGDGVDAGFANCSDLRFTGIVFTEQKALVSPREQGFYKMFPGIDGQLCGTFLRNFITEFNFDDNLITLNKKESFDPEKYPCKLLMERDSFGSYHIPVTIKRGTSIIKKTLYIDLGGIYPVSLVTGKDLPSGGGEAKKYLGSGASGPIYGYESTLDYVKIGEYTLPNTKAVFTEDKSGGDHTNMTIGLPLLMNFNVAFDYFDNVLYLVPNSNFQE